MVRQMTDSNIHEYGFRNTESGMPSRDNQKTVAVRKTALRDLQNENRVMVSKTMESSPFPKEKAPPVIDAVQIAGTKRSLYERLVSPSHYQSHGINAANGHIVYVRRKSEVSLNRSSASESRSNNSNSQYIKQLGHQEVVGQPKDQVTETKVSSILPSTPFPVASLPSHSTVKSSIPIQLGESAITLQPVEPSYVPIPNKIPSSDNTKKRRNQHWEEQFIQLQMLLEKLDQSNQNDYLQMLRSLSSVELSRHAVELEKRAIQLALEEAKEMERVVCLNVLGRSAEQIQAQPTQ